MDTGNLPQLRRPFGPGGQGVLDLRFTAGTIRCPEPNRAALRILDTKIFRVVPVTILLGERRRGAASDLYCNRCHRILIGVDVFPGGGGGSRSRRDISPLSASRQPDWRGSGPVSSTVPGAASRSIRSLLRPRYVIIE